MLVDVVMQCTFGDLTEADVEKDPLVCLGPCGHALTRSSLDGWMHMGE
jgi:hypothetical protein